MFEKDRAWIEIDRQALIHNVDVIRGFLPQGCELMACVKANGFGHGLIEVSRILHEHGVCNYCVACLSEAVELRKAGIDGEILILGYTDPSNFDALYEYHLSQAVTDCAYGRMLNALGKPLHVHIAVDTGMHRMGERCENVDEIASLWQLEHLVIDGLYSHLASAEKMDEASREFTRFQIDNFDRLISELRSRGIDGFRAHIQASQGMFNYSDLRYDLARIGVLLYGNEGDPSDKAPKELGLRHVLSLKARVGSVRKLHKGECVGYDCTFRADQNMICATIGIGYADGLPKSLSNKWHVLLGGRLCPIIGMLCMDSLMIDASSVPDVKAGDVATLIGTDGDLEIRACDLAAVDGVNTNAVLTKLSVRLGRVVV